MCLNDGNNIFLPMYNAPFFLGMSNTFEIIFVMNEPELAINSRESRCILQNTSILSKEKIL